MNDKLNELITQNYGESVASNWRYWLGLKRATNKFGSLVFNLNNSIHSQSSVQTERDRYFFTILKEMHEKELLPATIQIQVNR